MSIAFARHVIDRLAGGRQLKGRARLRRQFFSPPSVGAELRGGAVMPRRQLFFFRMSGLSIDLAGRGFRRFPLDQNSGFQKSRARPGGFGAYFVRIFVTAQVGWGWQAGRL
jgi:hypothetical protein